MDDPHAVGAQPGDRACDRPRGTRSREARPDRERDDVDACGAQLGLDLAARDEGMDARGEARAIEPAEHLLEVPLRAAGRQHGRKVRDPNHRAIARAGRPHRTRAGSAAGRPSRYRRRQMITPTSTYVIGFSHRSASREKAQYR